MSGGSHSLASMAQSGRASRRLVVVLVTLIIAATIGGAFAFFTTTDSSNPATAGAQSLPQGSTPTLASIGTTVTVTFSTVNTTGTPSAQVTNYNVLRYVSGTTTSTPITGSCSIVGTTVTCLDNAGSGNWQYTDTPVIANWSGAESAKSGFIAVGQPPMVSSINRNDANPTNAATVHWTVTFTQPVTNVATSDFSLVTTGVSGTPTITGLSPPSGPSATYVITASTSGVTGVGTIGLNLTSSGSIQNTSAIALSVTLPFVGQTYSFDTVAPVVTLARVNGNTVSFPLLTSQTVTSIGGACGTAAGDSGTVTVTVVGSTSGTSACTSGAWSFMLSPSLTNGTITATATQADAAGNVGTSGAKVITVDTTAPSVTLTKVNGASVAFPYFTSQTVTSLGGGCGVATGDNTTVTVSITIVTQTSTVNCTGSTWSFTLTTPLSASATYTATAVQRDAAGNTGSTGPQTIVIDKSPPTVTVTFPTPGTYSIGNEGTNSWDGNTCTIAGVTGSMCGTASDTGSGVARVQISFLSPSGKYWDGTFTGGAANFTLASPTFVAVISTTLWNQPWNNAAFGGVFGSFTVTAEAVDLAGNISNPVSVTFTTKK